MEDERNDSETTTDKEQEEQPVTAKNIVTVEDAGPCKKKIVVEIPEETVKAAIDAQYKELGQATVLPGFRKGRAPRRLLEKRFGKETSEQVKLKLLADSSEAAIKSKELDVLGDPEIDYEHIELPTSGPMKYEFEAEVRPEFDLPSLEHIAVTRPKLEVTDEQIDREVDQLRRWSGVWAPKEGGEVEQEDQIIADVLIRPQLTDEEKAEQAKQAAEGKETQVVEAETKLDNFEVYVRPHGFVAAVPVEKLDELLVGAAVGDRKTTTVEVSKTYFHEGYRGRKIDLEITIKDIKSLQLAEMDEAFLQRFEVKTVDELRERVRDNLKARLESQAQSDMSEQVYQYLLANTKFDLPVDLVGRQAGNLLQRQRINLLSRGLSPQEIEEQMEQLRASSEEQAEEQLKTFFIMDKVADKLEIDVTEEEINGQIAQMAAQRGKRPERMKEQMERDGSLAQFRLDARQNKCINQILQSADITEKQPEEKPKRTKKVPKKSAKEKTEESKQ
jgi:trigger factor